MIALGDYMGSECHACIGGTNVREDLHKLQAGVHIVVGTPGRVFDMINRRALSTSSFFFTFNFFLGVTLLSESNIL